MVPLRWRSTLTTYRSLMNTKAERFAYLHQVSEGQPYPSGQHPNDARRHNLHECFVYAYLNVIFFMFIFAIQIGQGNCLQSIESDRIWPDRIRSNASDWLKLDWIGWTELNGSDLIGWIGSDRRGRIGSNGSDRIESDRMNRIGSNKLHRIKWIG